MTSWTDELAYLQSRARACLRRECKRSSIAAVAQALGLDPKAVWYQRAGSLRTKAIEDALTFGERGDADRFDVFVTGLQGVVVSNVRAFVDRGLHAVTVLKFATDPYGSQGRTLAKVARIADEIEGEER
ncbi:hypothetical protein KQI63_15655 [bacterium]|nr:hypothetical protein [bacterium]